MYGAKASVDFYDKVIAPYKGVLEEWYVSNRNLYIYFMLIIITVWIVIYPKTKLQWVVLKGLPEPPEELKPILKFTE